MSLLQLIPVLLALAGLCSALTVFAGLPAGLAPIAALSLMQLVLAVAGVGGVLAPVVWLVLVLGLAGGAAAVFARYRRGAVPGGQSLSLAPVVFWGGAVLLAGYFSVLQPGFLNFDEYSFWGTASRLTSLNHTLYTECEIGTPWQITQTPAVPLLSYFVQLFGPFADWKTIWAVDLLLLAGVAAVVECAAKGGWRLQFPIALAGLLTPFVLVLYSHTSVLAAPYLEAMGDVVVGVLFGGAVAFWWAVRQRAPRLWWLMLPVACLVGNIKDNTFVLGLAAAGIAAADLVFFGRFDGGKRLTARRLAGRCCGALTLLAAPAVQYLIWNRYIAALVARNAESGGMGTTSQPLTTVLVQGIRLLLGLPAADYFEARRETAFAYVDTLADRFFTYPVSLLGSGAAVVTVIALLFAGAILLAPTLRQKLRAVLTALCSAACFGGYWLMLLLSYAFILKDSSPQNPASYSRYFQSYYLGWFLLALAVFAAAAVQAKPFRVWLGRAAALAVGAVFCTLSFINLEPQYTVFGVPQTAYTAQRQAIDTAEWAVQQIPAGETIFLVHQGDDGYHWFEYSCRLLPRILVYGTGGGTYGLPEYAQGRYDQPCTADEFLALVQDSGASWLLITRSDAVFEQSYAALFRDSLAAAADGAAVLYRVQADGFAPAATAGEGRV